MSPCVPNLLYHESAACEFPFILDAMVVRGYGVVSRCPVATSYDFKEISITHVMGLN